MIYVEPCNTLLLFTHIERHGRILYDLLEKEAGDRHVYFIHGGIDVEDREAIRKIVTEEKDAILVASFGVFSEGINAPELHNTIYASAYKSRIRNVQAIGRGLRVSDTKKKSNLYDISDDLTSGRMNHTLRHFVHRIRLYESEKFPYRIHRVDLKY